MISRIHMEPVLLRMQKRCVALSAYTVQSAAELARIIFAVHGYISTALSWTESCNTPPPPLLWPAFLLSPSSHCWIFLPSPSPMKPNLSVTLSHRRVLLFVLPSFLSLSDTHKHGSSLVKFQVYIFICGSLHDYQAYIEYDTKPWWQHTCGRDIKEGLVWWGRNEWRMDQLFHWNYAKCSARNIMLLSDEGDMICAVFVYLILWAIKLINTNFLKLCFHFP